MHAEHDFEGERSGAAGLGVLFGIGLIGAAIIVTILYAFS
jgi:hypothetical protein